MLYFLGGNLGPKLTGIEKAMLNRMNLLEKNGLVSKMVFVKWNPRLHEHASIYQRELDVFSVYDYFQGAKDYIQSKKVDWLSLWTDKRGYELVKVEETNDIKVFHKGNYLMYAHFVDSDYLQLDYINFFDRRLRKYKREFYDSRGFKSCTRVLTDNQKTLVEYYYTVNGKVCIEKYFTPMAENKCTSIVVYDSFGEVLLENDSELIAYFIERIFKEGDIFFSDKNLLTAPAFNLTSNNIPVFAVLHSTHLKNNNTNDMRMKNTYKDIFGNLSRYKGLIVSTEMQKSEVENYIENEVPVYTIPVGFTKEMSETEKNIITNKPYTIISVARYSPEKQLDHQIRAIKNLIDKGYNIQLNIFGYGQEFSKLSSLISELKVDNYVKLRGFTTNIEKEYCDSDLSILTSNMEGFSLAVLEAMSYSLPVISYDIKYGPNEMISDGENGFLVPLNNEEILAEKIEELYNDKNKQLKFSHVSHLRAQKYNEKNIYNKWKQLLIDAQQ